jgi:hypothetical protein
MDKKKHFQGHNKLKKTNFLVYYQEIGGNFDEDLFFHCK